ncbi:MAG: Flap endonuclease Xni [Fimbriimonadaceae bacterium]|nr:Flap endonuclease Xni [Fimbriimonadaceae bacterium]
MSEARPLLIVDGDNLAHRSYHSTPKTVTGVDDRPINAIVGFFHGILANWNRERPRAVFVAWDTLGVETYRNKLWPDYQSGRVFDQAIIDQLDELPDLCRAFGLGVGKAAGYEADDLMASAAKQEVAAGGTCLLWTTDRDAYQLVSESVTVISPQKGNPEPARIGPLQVVARMGVLPEQICDFKALCGDSSDRIPGAKGVGEKGAAALILKHGTLEAVLAAGWNSAEAERLRMFYDVVTMRPEIEVTLPAGPPNWRAGSEALRAIGAENLAERFAAME